ncbi:MAG TPA: ribosome maturation factor RimP [Acidimicrobiales bacterium]|nr:ribosome maturation factor RimP [Acidimicrobiales bacterium]
MEFADTVRTLVEPALAAKGYEVFDVEFGGGRLVVTVTRPGQALDLEALTEANHVVSDLLDEHDPIPADHYLLEVSSPGLERALRTPAHFHGALGETVSIKTKPHVEGERRHQGLLEAADDTGVSVGGRRFSYADIEKARTVFVWGPAPKPTTKKKKVAST